MRGSTQSGSETTASLSRGDSADSGACLKEVSELAPIHLTADPDGQNDSDVPADATDSGRDAGVTARVSRAVVRVELLLPKGAEISAAQWRADSVRRDAFAGFKMARLIFDDETLTLASIEWRETGYALIRNGETLTV